MKCAYNNCKLGGNVEKDVAIKFNNRYYHSECFDKKSCKERCSDLLKSKGFIVKNINLALKKIIDDNSANPKFVEFAIDYVLKNKKPLNSPFGVSYYLENFELIQEFNRVERLRKIQELRDSEFEIDNVEVPEIKYTPKTAKYLKIL